jgi:hypothetical protein
MVGVMMDDNKSLNKKSGSILGDSMMGLLVCAFVRKIVQKCSWERYFQGYLVYLVLFK